MKMIEVENLKYRYPLAAEMSLKGITFSVERGEFIGVIGANLAGKSTLCQALVGLVPHFYRGAYGGRVLVSGLEVGVSSISELSAKVGLVFQNPFTQVTGARMTVYEEIAFGLENLGFERKIIIERVDDALNLLDMYKYKDRNPFDLSGGQMQRMAIAGIIAMKPEVIVLDEPTSQLDPQGAEEVFLAVQSLSKEGMTIIMVEQKAEKLARYCDKVLLLHQGKIVDFDLPERVFSRSDLESYGVVAPAFTQACKELGLTKTASPLYPVTLDEAYEVVVGSREQS